MASLNEQFKHEVSITEKEHALRLFTDRITERRLFASYVNEDPAPGTILFFHGDGGNGKSLLLQTLTHLRRFFMKSGQFLPTARSKINKIF